jgi:cbb3-type cytochrome oxidase maturation protein
MDVLYLLIPLSVLIVFAIGAVFWWAVEGGQFEDFEGPAQSVLDDDGTPPA